MTFEQWWEGPKTIKEMTTPVRDLAAAAYQAGYKQAWKDATNFRVIPPDHITDGTPCWCNPETTYTDPNTGKSVIVHKEPQ